MSVDTKVAVPRQRDSRPDPAESWALVRQAQAGDSAAKAEIYRRYHMFVFRFVLARVGGYRHVAEDLTSEAFLRALRRIDSFTWQGRDLGTWLVTIARNIVVDYHKGGHGRFELAYDPASPVILREPRVQPSAEEIVLTLAQDRALWRAVAALGQLQRQVITLRFLRGLNVEETAAAMGTNIGVVKSVQYRAVRALRRALPAEVRL